MKSFGKRLFIFIIIFTALFLLAITFDISPNLRGPYDPNLDFRWPYYFVNTINKIWAPLAVFLLILLLFNYFDNYEKKNLSQKRELFLLAGVFLLGFLLQIALVYFSRFGINILFRRMADPGINGYFSTAVKHPDIFRFMRDYPYIASQLDQHAITHPPGVNVLLNGIINFFSAVPQVTKFLSQYINPPSEPNSFKLWLSLTEPQRIAAIISAFITHLLSLTAIIPLYFSLKNVLGIKTAVRSVFLYVLIPSIAFFAPLFDPIYSLFSVLSFYLIVKGIIGKKYVLIFLSGLILGIGFFFSFSLIPIFVIAVLFCLLMYMKKRRTYIIKDSLYFIAGILTWIIITYLFGFNFISAFFTATKSGSHLARSYISSLWANPYDFFIFLGIPTAILFLTFSFEVLRKKIQVQSNFGVLLVSFWSTFLLLNISGSARGEVGRIWAPLMLFPIFFAGYYSTSVLKFKTRIFSWLIILLFCQLIIFEEFWVPVW